MLEWLYFETIFQVTTGMSKGQTPTSCVRDIVKPTGQTPQDVFAIL